MEKIREAARKARVHELRLIGRRSWWPQFDPNAAMLASPASQAQGCSAAARGRKWDGRKQTKRKEEQLLVNFPADRSRYKQSTKAAKNPLMFWKRKKEETVPSQLTACESNDSSTELLEVTPTQASGENMHGDNPANKDAIEEGEEDGKGEKKKKNRWVAAAAATASTVGVAAAIILL